MVDPEPSAAASAVRRTEPGMLAPPAVRSPPQIDQTNFSQPRKGIAALEPVISSIDPRGARVEVANHQKWQPGSPTQPAGGGAPKRGNRRSLRRPVYRRKPYSEAHHLELEPATRKDPSVRRPTLGDTHERNAGQHTLSPVIRPGSAEAVLISQISQHMTEISGAPGRSFLEGDDVGIVAP
jgi:hypothetical protein